MAKRIDDSHQPFKRTSKIGPGPKKAPMIKKADQWECHKGKREKGKYVQLCKYIGDNANMRGKVRKVKTKIARKKAYNKLYRAWAKKNRAKLQARAALPSYKCRRTAATKCK